MLTSAKASAENGVSAGGLMTAVQPAANAAPSFRVIIAEGKFHGVRILTTPCKQLVNGITRREIEKCTYGLLDHNVAGAGEGRRDLLCLWLGS